MADNTTLSAAVGSGDTVRDKDRAGTKTQIVGVDWGIGSATETLATIGQKAMAACPCVSLASDQTAIPASQSGTWTVSLPTGASTAAKQPALGTAGTASADVITVQGIASMTKLLVTPDLPSGASTAAKQPALGTAGSASADVITVQGVASMTPLLVTLSGTNNIATVTTVTSLSQWAGNAIDTNSGNKSAGTLRVVLATDQPALTNKLLVTPDLPSGASTAAKQPALGTAGTASADVVTVQGVASMTKLLVTPDANSAVNLAQVAGASTATGHGTASGAVRVELPTDGTGQVTVANSSLSVAAIPKTSGGLTPYSVISSGAANQDAAAIKGSAGQVYGWSLQNTTSSARYVKLYNKASGVTSSDTPVLRLYLPPTGGNNATAADLGVAFGTGISIRITSGAADNDTGACSANDVLANVLYN